MLTYNSRNATKYDLDKALAMVSIIRQDDQEWQYSPLHYHQEYYVIEVSDRDDSFLGFL